MKLGLFWLLNKFIKRFFVVISRLFKIVLEEYY